MRDKVTSPRDPERRLSGQQLYSFDRVALKTLGFYEPGKTAQLNDPAFTGAEFPRAVVAHELVHQNLMLNTTFGVFTQTVNHLRSRGIISDAPVEACHDAQWTVQEATATYVELLAVAREAPGALTRQINALPSLRNMQPPYLESFETIAVWLPLDAGDNEATLRAKELLVQFLAYAAMNTSCLRLGLKDAPTDQVVLDCIRDTPDDRLQQLLAALGQDGTLSSLFDEGRRLVRDGAENRFLATFVRALSAHGFAWERDEDFRPAAARLSAFWSPFLPNVQSVWVDKDPLPGVAYGSERAADELAQHPPAKLRPGAVAEFASKAATLQLAVIIELALRDPSLVHVKLGAYVPVRRASPWPASNVSEQRTAGIPPDIHGLLPPETLLRELDRYSAVPRVVSLLLPGGIRQWANVPGSDAIFRRAITVCRLTDVSSADIEEATRESGGREYLVLRLTPKLRLGCILQKGGHSFVIGRITSDVAFELFVSICETLGITSATDPDSLHRERDLLSMIGGF